MTYFHLFYPLTSQSLVQDLSDARSFLRFFVVVNDGENYF